MGALSTDCRSGRGFAFGPTVNRDRTRARVRCIADGDEETSFKGISGVETVALCCMVFSRTGVINAVKPVSLESLRNRPFDGVASAGSWIFGVFPLLLKSDSISNKGNSPYKTMTKANAAFP